MWFQSKAALYCSSHAAITQFACRHHWSLSLRAGGMTQKTLKGHMLFLQALPMHRPSILPRVPAAKERRHGAKHFSLLVPHQSQGVYRKGPCQLRLHAALCLRLTASLHASHKTQQASARLLRWGQLARASCGCRALCQAVAVLRCLVAALQHCPAVQPCCALHLCVPAAHWNPPSAPTKGVPPAGEP